MCLLILQYDKNFAVLHISFSVVQSGGGEPAKSAWSRYLLCSSSSLFSLFYSNVINCVSFINYPKSFQKEAGNFEIKVICTY